MQPRRSKTERLSDEIRLALQNGRYAPGEHIDPAALARRFGISLTPVRSALQGLAGEGVIEFRTRDGFYVPLFTDRQLREWYDCMERRLHWACDILSASADPAPAQLDLSDLDEGNELATRTRHLFERIAFETDHHLLQQLVRQANAQLGPIRRAERGFIDDAFDELAELYLHWETRDTAALKTALSAYHDRRRRLVPRLVALIGRPSPYAPRRALE